MIFRHIWHIWRYKQISQGEAQGTGTNRGTPWEGNSICAVHTEDRWSSASYPPPPPLLLKVSEMCLIITHLIVICLRLMLLKSSEVGSLSAQISMDNIKFRRRPFKSVDHPSSVKIRPFVIFYLYSTSFLFCVSLWLLLLSKFKIISKGFIL